MTTDLAVKVLAVIGGGVGGGLGLGFLARLLIRTLTVHKPPRWSLLLVHLLGGTICGWLVALWLFGGGGPGIGGSGGWGFGSGSGNGANDKTVPIRENANEGEQTESEKQAADGETLRIEVLGHDALKNANEDATHCYRVERKEGTSYWTFEEVKAEVQNRRVPRMEIVLYKDSPNDDRSVVNQLRNWGRERKIRVDITKSTADAPR